MSNKYDTQFLALVKKILDNGDILPCRTGNNTIKLLNQSLTVDLADGFPALTFRPLPFKGARVELSGFLQGITDKQWYMDNGCKYWKEWANPTKADASDKEAQFAERDLGPIYGFQYRHFGAKYDSYDTDYTGKGVDQLQSVVDTLKTNPYDRRMIISAWNPLAMAQMALPACLYLFQFNYVGERLHMTAQMRSTDIVLGCPTDIMFCALFLTLMAQTVGMKPGTVHLNMADCHIYDNHVDLIRENLEAEQFDLPTLSLDPDATVFNFSWEMAKLEGYVTGPKLTFPIAV